MVEQTQIHTFLQQRRSIRAFDKEKNISRKEIEALLDAARWAASCFNEQPWRFIVARRGTPTFDKIFDTLMEGNQIWAKDAALLIIAASKTTFSANGKPNHHHAHDLGLAIGNLSVEATARHIFVHQMAGFDAKKAKNSFDFPEDVEPLTAIALGYKADPAQLPEKLQAAETAERKRKSREEVLIYSDF
ncbi:MAG: nitroreductase family protein [Bernardetiaceae bacterium]|nr:nitroreductase family protein [Bernardetiaceae bacterium]